MSAFGIIVTAFLCSIGIISLKKCITNHTFKTIIDVLCGLGCGALLGDAMVHIVPDAYEN